MQKRQNKYYSNQSLCQVYIYRKYVILLSFTCKKNVHLFHKSYRAPHEIQRPYTRQNHHEISEIHRQNSRTRRSSQDTTNPRIIRENTRKRTCNRRSKGRRFLGSIEPRPDRTSSFRCQAQQNGTISRKVLFGAIQHYSGRLYCREKRSATRW